MNIKNKSHTRARKFCCLIPLFPIPVKVHIVTRVNISPRVHRLSGVHYFTPNGSVRGGTKDFGLREWPEPGLLSGVNGVSPELNKVPEFYSIMLTSQKPSGHQPQRLPLKFTFIHPHQAQTFNVSGFPVEEKTRNRRVSRKYQIINQICISPMKQFEKNTQIRAFKSISK